MKPTLYTYSLEFQAIQDLINNPTVDENGVIEDTELLEAMFNDLSLSASEKLNNVQKYRLELLNDQQGLKDLAKHYTDKAKVAENKANRMKEILHSFVANMPDKKFDSGEFKFSVSKGAAALVMTIADDELPREFRAAKWSADKAKIKEALKNGVELQGCSLEVKESLRVK